MTKLRGLKQKLFNKISALILKYDLAENDVEISTNNFGNETTILLNFKMSDNKIWNDQTVSFYQNKPKPPPAMTTDSMTCYLKKIPSESHCSSSLLKKKHDLKVTRARKKSSAQKICAHKSPAKAVRDRVRYLAYKRRTVEIDLDSPSNSASMSASPQHSSDVHSYDFDDDPHPSTTSWNSSERYWLEICPMLCPDQLFELPLRGVE